MDSNTLNLNFFALITELCKSLLRKYSTECLDGRDVIRILNKMRRIAFEIMLKKHPESLHLNGWLIYLIKLFVNYFNL